MKTSQKKAFWKTHFVCNNCELVIELTGRKKPKYCTYCNDGYIKTLLRQKGCKNPPIELVELKRKQIAIKRQLDSNGSIAESRYKKSMANYNYQKGIKKFTLEDYKSVNEKIFSQLK